MSHFFFLNPLPFLQVRSTIQGTAVGVSHCVSYTFSLTKHPHPNFFCRSRKRNRLFSHTMSYRRDIRNSRSAIFDDGLEEGGLRASSSYSHSINEHDNDKAIDSLQDRVIFLKRLTGDIHEEVESHNRLLDRMVCLHVFSSSNSPENNLWPFI
ncbi:hypothetical protein MANES_15G038000v8 [Manihot esculenta]|uniref:Uncharacterized protein n=1 Tax=Manihot esculenta TaxID=3983 RepID=A0ACB7G939_MANES|nr:hypothetical protein MANES_15G038000v8 [Manihot esculenta]